MVPFGSAEQYVAFVDVQDKITEVPTGTVTKLLWPFTIRVTVGAGVLSILLL